MKDTGKRWKRPNRKNIKPSSTGNTGFCFLRSVLFVCLSGLHGKANTMANWCEIFLTVVVYSMAFNSNSFARVEDDEEVYDFLSDIAITSGINGGKNNSGKTPSTS